jgi:putative acetyltransferase
MVPRPYRADGYRAKCGKGRMMVTIELRSERIGDEHAIDVVNCAAFEEMAEANLVRLMRKYYPMYDARFSITAWDGGEMVGHTLFSPARIRLMGETVPALAVGPVAVLPERQRTGLGGAMLRYGHELGRREGFALAFLYGHPSYYPRHGYVACYGFGKAAIDKDKLPAPQGKYRRMPVRAADIPWLVQRHAAEWADVDFGWLREASLGEWTIPFINAMIWWTDDGRRAAYTLTTGGRDSCKMLLADDPALARDVIATIRPATMEHHPSGWLARHVLEPLWSSCAAKASDAAMVCELRPGVLAQYRQALAAGKRPPGFAMFPLAFMAC